MTNVDGGEPEIEINDSVGAEGFTKLDITRAPVVVTLARIGNHCIVDPSPEEEECSSASLLVAVTPDGSFSTVKKLGGGSFHPSTVMSAVKMAGEVGVEINKVMMMKIEQEERLGDNREKVGFL